MKSKKLLLFWLFLSVFALLSVGCASDAIRIYEPGDASELMRDENGKIIPGEGLVCIALYGKDGAIILDETLVYVDYKKEVSVADLSRDICREKNIPIAFAGMGSMSYVSGIGNVFEFDDGPESGWIYSVNGEYQGVGCGSYILKEREYVEWRYSLDLGRDLGAYFLDDE
ncbi:MAG: DUF4430 domain-containing protein [Oscillospiraceae bacterium]|nr:DUF4430 domain-containing protein [Oscillospiraceae bacterium]